MTINIASTFERGGSDMVALLSYCIYSRKFDPVFTLLVKNFQLMPRSAKALALFDEFVAVGAPLPLSTDPGADYMLLQTIEKIRSLERSSIVAAASGQADEEGNQNGAALFTPYLPAKYLFDGIQRSVAADSEQSQIIEGEYDLSKSALENMPDGKLSGTQLQFVERVWKPARQRLTVAGFRMVANICG